MKVSRTYESKLVIAGELARMGMRAVTLTDVAMTKPADSREAYRAINGKQSSSGQTPTFHRWFFQTKTRRMHAALLCLMYVKYRKFYEGRDPNPHGMAFTVAFKTYKNILGERPLDEENEITGERLNLLIGKGFEVTWKRIAEGERTTFGDDEAKVMACRKCRVPHLAEAHRVDYVCDTCS